MLSGDEVLDVNWSDSDREDKAKLLSATLHAKGITPNRHVVVYGTNQEDRDRVATYLGELDFKQVCGFDLNTWANEATASSG